MEHSINNIVIICYEIIFHFLNNYEVTKLYITTFINECIDNLTLKMFKN